MNSATYLEAIWRDIVHALKMMRKAPAFTATAVLTLALGIAGNTAMFTMIRAVLLKPLSYGNPDRLVYFSLDNPRQNVREGQFAKTMDAVLDAALGQRRLTMLLLGLFAAFALLLAVLGIYGVISYSVAQRTQELGIRQALGAQRGDILRLIVSQGLGLTLAGIGIGISGAFILTRVMKSLLFHVSATDPVTFTGIAVLFLVVALVASYIPARRATRIDPMAALRVG